MKRFLMTIIVAVVTTSVYAQIDYDRISLGFNMLGHDVTGVESSVINKRLKGVSIEYTKGISLTSNFPLYLEVGCRVSYNATKYNESKLKMLGVTVPAGLTYVFNPGGDWYIAPYAGIHGRFNVLAKEVINGKKYNMIMDKDAPVTYNVAQFGGQYGVNFGWRIYNFGFAYINNTPLYNKDGNKCYNNEWTIYTSVNL